MGPAKVTAPWRDALFWNRHESFLNKYWSGRYPAKELYQALSIPCYQVVTPPKGAMARTGASWSLPYPRFPATGASRRHGDGLPTPDLTSYTGGMATVFRPLT